MATWRSTLSSPLVRRITVVVFCCIMAIEALLLGVSYFSERKRLLAHVATAAELMLPAFMSAQDQGASLAPLLNHDHARYPLVGYRITLAGGDSWAGGQITPAPGGHPEQAEFLDIANALFLVTAQSPTGRFVTLVFDVRQIDQALVDYVWRIIGLVLLIAAFVTAGTLLALGPILLRPLMTMRGLLHSSGKAGLTSTQVPGEHLRRNDEIGDVYRAFDQMRTALLSADRENQRITARFQDFASLGADCFWELDRRMRISFIAGDVRAMFKMRPERLTGSPLRAVLRSRGMSPCDARQMMRALRREGHWEGSFEPVPQDDKPRLTTRITAHAYKDEQGRTLGIRGIIADTTVANELARELEHMATHDALTGLLNRRAFDQHLGDALERANDGGPASTLCVMDLDRFKQVNDHCGHAAGDALLRQIAELLRAHVRRSDVVARIGGDEFALLLDGCQLSQGLRVAETIRQAIDRFRFQWEGGSYDVGVSIGVAQTEPLLARSSDLMRAADACCFRAKQLGRNLVQAYQAGQDVSDATEAATSYRTQIEWAFTNDAFELHAQPAVALDDPDTLATLSQAPYIELLLRMRRNDDELLVPGAFLSCADRYGMSERLDRHVVSMALEWIGSNDALGDTRSVIGINLTGATLADDLFHEHLAEEISTHEIDPARLCFEISESSALMDPATTQRFLTRLRQTGCKTAIDDFGGGLATLDHLKTLPVDYLKIDGSFTRHVVTSEIDHALVECIARVATMMGMMTIAEEVADSALAHALGNLGIDFAQGFYFAGPCALSHDHNPSRSPGEAIPVV